MIDFDLRENMLMVKEMRGYALLLGMSEDNQFDKELSRKLKKYATSLERATKQLDFLEDKSVGKGESK